MKIRLQKLLSQAGICSRRKAEEYISQGKVLINGQIATLGDKADESDNILCNGQVVKLKNTETVLIAYHKPVGVECTFATVKGTKTLADIDFGTRVVSVGRLDKESRGLLLLTNDGDLANKLSHPRYQKEKRYVVKVHKNVTKEHLDAFRAGMTVPNKHDSTKPEIFQPCKAINRGDKSFEIILKEGRNRQIRRMCIAVGLEVLDLFRTQVGIIELGDLPEGTWKRISVDELEGIE